MSPEEQETWDMLTWVTQVDLSTLEYDAVDEVIEYGKLFSGVELTTEQLTLYIKYYPDVIEQLADDYWEYANDYYDDGYYDYDDEEWLDHSGDEQQEVKE